MEIVPEGAVLKVTGDISGFKIQAVIPKTMVDLNSAGDDIWFCFSPDDLHPPLWKTMPCSARFPQLRYVKSDKTDKPARINRGKTPTVRAITRIAPTYRTNQGERKIRPFCFVPIKLRICFRPSHAE